MKRRLATRIQLLFLAFTVALLALPRLAYAVEAPDEPQNGIPLLIVRVDENAEDIAAANANDPNHSYGNIEEMNGSEEHSVRSIGSVEILVPDGYVGDYGSSEVPDGPVELKYIRGRGNSTWCSDKKPYKIEFNDRYDLFGMGESKEWALIANAKDVDPSTIHNRVAYWIADAIGLPYTPQLIPVDFVMVGMDGDTETSRSYLGTYYLSELIDVEASRLPIDKLKDDVTSSEPTEDPNITGGYLLSIYFEFQNSDEPESNVFTTNSGITFINELPEFESEDLTEGRSAQRTYIREYVNQIDDLIMASETIDADTHDAIAELLDLRSAADYW